MAIRKRKINYFKIKDVDNIIYAMLNKAFPIKHNRYFLEIFKQENYLLRKSTTCFVVVPSFILYLNFPICWYLTINFNFLAHLRFFAYIQFQLSEFSSKHVLLYSIYNNEKLKATCFPFDVCYLQSTWKIVSHFISTKTYYNLIFTNIPKYGRIAQN